jgi:hypothetical protein
VNVLVYGLDGDELCLTRQVAQALASQLPQVQLGVWCAGEASRHQKGTTQLCMAHATWLGVLPHLDAFDVNLREAPGDARLEMCQLWHLAEQLVL